MSIITTNFWVKTKGDKKFKTYKTKKKKHKNVEVHSLRTPALEYRERLNEYWWFLTTLKSCATLEKNIFLKATAFKRSMLHFFHFHLL